MQIGNMKLEIQMFGGRGASSSNKKYESFEILTEKRQQMNKYLDINRGIDLFEKKGKTTSITTYKIGDLERVTRDIDETIVQVQQGSYEKRISQLKDLGFNVVSRNRTSGDKTSVVLVHIKKGR